MLRHAINSGAFRFALLVAALFAFASLLILLVVERSVSAYANEATATGLRSETAILARELPDGGPSELIDTIRHRQRSTAEQPFRYLLVDVRGGRLAGDLPLSAAKAGWSEVVFLDDHPAPGEEGSPETLQTLGTRLPGRLLLIVATDTYDIQKLRARLDRFTIGAGIAITLLVLIGGYLIGGLLLRRLERVNDAISRVMAGDLSERLPPIGMAPEFDRLSTNLNLMLDRIGMLVEGLRQVSTDIAHDLRTPLTRLRQQLEDLQENRSPAEYRAGVEVALAQTEEVLIIFRALLRLGMIEAGEARELFAPVDLTEIAERMAQVYRPTAEDAGLVIATSITPSQIICGDQELLSQVFANLFDNAIAHAAGATRVTILIERVGDQTIVAVADDGAGIPPDVQTRIFERFYRYDLSRGGSGAGLGLSLVRAIVGLHGGTVRHVPAPSGFCIEMRFDTRQVRARSHP